MKIQMTLWESAEVRQCTWCGKPGKVWNPFEALAKGESTSTIDLVDEGGKPIRIIDLNWKGYEGVCNVCRREDIEFRWRMSCHERREAAGKPIPKWIWGEWSGLKDKENKWKTNL